MQCAEIVEQLSAYADGMLGGSERRIVDEHLAHCVRCQAMLRRQRQTRQLLHLTRGDTWTPPDLRLRIRRAASAPIVEPRRRMPVLAIGSMVAVLLLGVVLASYTLVPRGRHAPSQQASAVASVRAIAAPPRAHSVCIACLANALVQQLKVPQKLNAGLMVEVTLAFSTASTIDYPPLPAGWPAIANVGSHAASKGGESHQASAVRMIGPQAS